MSDASPQGFLQAFLAVLVVYVAAGTAIALVSRRFGVKTTREYFVAGHRLGGVLSAMTYAATTYSAFMMVGLVGITYATGAGALGFELAYLFATLLLLGLFATRVWSMARERGWVSASEMLSDLYGSEALGIAAVALYLVALLPYTAAQMIGIGSIFEGLGAGYGTGIAVAAILVLLWVVVAGVWSIATTDLFQGLWMIFAAAALVTWLTLAFVPSQGVSLADIAKALTDSGYSGITPFWSIPTFLAFTIPWWFFAVTNPHVVRKLFMPADERSLKTMVKYFGIYGLAYTVLVVFVGLVARGLTELGVFEAVSNRDLVTPLLLLRLDPVTASVIYVSIVAAAVTTANSIIFSVASSFVRDIYERKIKGGDGGRKSILIANAVVTALTSAAAAIAYARPTFIVEMSVLSSVILLPLAPITIAAWLTPKKARTKPAANAATASLLIGAGAALAAAVALGPKKALITTYCGIPLSAIILATTTVIVAAGYSLTKLR